MMLDKSMPFSAGLLFSDFSSLGGQLSLLKAQPKFTTDSNPLEDLRSVQAGFYACPAGCQHKIPGTATG